MKRTITTGLLTVVFLGLSTAAQEQDWYHDRDGRWSANQAADKERKRLERTKQELTDLQAKLDHGEWDNGHVNDVIDSLRKSANAIGYRSATGQC
jgi:small-conductance mechanosensitive channel